MNPFSGPSPESKFHSVKQALHTAVPERLLSREAERSSIRSFLEDKALKASPASLYISGAPGTGKTACLNCVLQEMKVSATVCVSLRFVNDRLIVSISLALDLLQHSLAQC